MSDNHTYDVGAIPSEDGTWLLVIPGMPFHANAATLDEAIAELVEEFREYADEWRIFLHDASNHAHHERFVEFVEQSTDEELTAWVETENGGVLP